MHVLSNLPRPEKFNAVPAEKRIVRDTSLVARHIYRNGDIIALLVNFPFSGNLTSVAVIGGRAKIVRADDDCTRARVSLRTFHI